MRHVQRVLDLLEDLRDTTASIYYVPDVFVFDLIQSRTGEILGMPVVAMCETPFFGYRGVVKRVMDVVIASLALLALSPLLLLVALLVKFTSPGPGRSSSSGATVSMARKSGLQVPDHDGDRGRRSDPPGHASTTIASRRSGACCAAIRSTSCRSSSTCSRAR